MAIWSQTLNWNQHSFHTFFSHKTQLLHFKNFLFRNVAFHNLISSSPFDVAIGTIVDECFDTALVVVVTALFHQSLATPRRLVKASDNRDFLLEGFDHCHSAVNPHRTLQLDSAVGSLVFRNLQVVSIVKRHCFACSRCTYSNQNHQSYCETKKLSQEHFRRMRESTGTSDGVMKISDLKITFWLQRFNSC